MLCMYSWKKGRFGCIHSWLGLTSHFILEISEKSFAKAGVWLNTVCIHNLISNKIRGVE